MPGISELFGGERLTYEELMEKAAAAGCEIGDLSKARRDHDEEIRSIRVSGAVERAAYMAGAKNTELLMRVIDRGAVTVDGSGVHGLSEQITRLRESDPYLFNEEKLVTVDTGMRHEKEQTDPDRLSDEEYYKRLCR